MPKDKVVSNTTPIITLSRIGYLWLLNSIYKSIIIPQAVFDEIMAKHDKVSAEVNNSDWIQVQKIKNVNVKLIFSSSLHSGEIEAIILADEINADLIIIDDFLARKYVLQTSRSLTGTLGILLRAKKKGLIPLIRPLLDRIIKEGIYINQKLFDDVLELANEKSL